MELSSSCCTDINIHINLRRVSQGVSVDSSIVKPLVLYAMEHRIAMAQMRGKWASSCVDFRYTDLFCIPELISEFISSGDSVLGDPWCSIKKIEAPYVFNSRIYPWFLPQLEKSHDTYPSLGDEA